MTQTYIVRQSSIASVQYITLPEGRQISAVFRGPNVLPRQGATPLPAEFDAPVPMTVRAEVNRRFGIIFSAPVIAREEIVRRLQPVEIQA